jgi:hypothetical protein
MYRYFRYTTEERLELHDVHRTIGETGGLLVRIDSREGRTEITVAVSDGSTLAASPRFGEGVEVSEDEVSAVSS